MLHAPTSIMILLAGSEGPGDPPHRALPAAAAVATPRRGRGRRLPHAPLPLRAVLPRKASSRLLDELQVVTVELTQETQVALAKHGAPAREAAAE